MMVRQNQAFRGDERAGPAAQEDDRILQAGAVRIVDLSGGELEAMLLHLGPRKLVELGQHPHPLIRRAPSREEENGSERQKNSGQRFLHGKLLLVSGLNVGSMNILNSGLKIKLQLTPFPRIFGHSLQEVTHH